MFCRIYFQQAGYLFFVHFILAPLFRLFHLAGIVIRTILAEQRNLLAQRISQQLGHLMSAVDVVVRVVLTTVWQCWMLAWLVPHMQLLRALDTQALLQVVGNLSGVDEVDVQTIGHITWSHSI